MAKHVNQTSAAPTRKVAAGSVGGAVGVILIFVLSQFGVEVPAEVAAAISTVLGFAMSYLVPERA